MFHYHDLFSKLIRVFDYLLKPVPYIGGIAMALWAFVFPSFSHSEFLAGVIIAMLGLCLGLLLLAAAVMSGGVIGLFIYDGLRAWQKIKGKDPDLHCLHCATNYRETEMYLKGHPS